MDPKVASLKRKYLVSNGTMLTISKSNKYETCHQKIITPLINERHVLMGTYFYTRLSFIGF